MPRPSKRLWVTLAILLVLAVGSAGAVIAWDHTSPSAPSPPSALPSPGFSSPQRAVAGYIDAMAADNFHLAATFIAPGSRSTFEATYFGITKADISELELKFGLSIGSVATNGQNPDDATVVLTGSQCNSGECYSNQNPTDPEDPIFELTTSLVDGSWYVDQTPVGSS